MHCLLLFPGYEPAPNGHSCVSQYSQFIDAEDVPASAYGLEHAPLGRHREVKYLPSLSGPQFLLYNCLDTIPSDLHQTIISDNRLFFS